MPIIIDRKSKHVLLTGATGYVGGRLLGALEQAGYQTRCLTRRVDNLNRRVGEHTEVVQGDVLDAQSLADAFEGMDVAFYLVHSMGSTGGFEEEDRQAARNFAQAAKQAGVGQIVYLGGLGEGQNLSSHLRSRQEVGEILRESGVPTIEFRASIIIGSGSLSFELVRSLVQKLPVMITPKWVHRKAQPIAIEDVIQYLLAAIDLPEPMNRVFEIGGADQVSYWEIMREYARQRQLRRLMIPVPFITPWLSSLWLGLVTPLYARIGRKLIDSLRNDTVVSDTDALLQFPVKPRGIEEAIARALGNEDREFAETCWSDAFSSGGKQTSWGGIKFGSRLVDSRTLKAHCSADNAFRAISQIGGQTGWYYGNWLWRLRGFLDLLVGGVGMRRGRRHPEQLVPGDTVDFWRVEQIDQGKLLRLAAEMKVPGRAWLQFEVVPDGDEDCSMRQTALFDPVGVFGILYWYSLFPVHGFIFGGMLRGIARAASRMEHNAAVPAGMLKVP